MKICGNCNEDSYINLVSGGEERIPEGFIGGRKHYAVVRNNTGSDKVYAYINIFSKSSGRCRYIVSDEE